MKIIDEFRKAGVTLYVDGGKLRYRGPKEKLTPELLAELRERKQELVAYLQDPRRPPAVEEALRPGMQVATCWTGAPNIEGTIKEIVPGAPGWPPIALVETDTGQAQVMLTTLRPVEGG